MDTNNEPLVALTWCINNSNTRAEFLTVKSSIVNDCFPSEPDVILNPLPANPLSNDGDEMLPLAFIFPSTSNFSVAVTPTPKPVGVKFKWEPPAEICILSPTSWNFINVSGLSLWYINLSIPTSPATSND